ncbi:hypothetical protein VYU27_008004 [Nannochloropsis oceanica]
MHSLIFPSSPPSASDASAWRKRRRQQQQQQQQRQQWHSVLSASILLLVVFLGGTCLAAIPSATAATSTGGTAWEWPSRFVVQASSAVDRSSSSSSSSMVTPKRKFLSALPKQKQSNSANSPTPATAVSLATPAASPSSATAAAAVAAAAATAANWLAPVVKAVEGAGSALGTFGLVIQSKKDHLVAGAVARGLVVGSLHPVDTIKIRVQMFGKAGLQRLNVQALYAGITSSLLGQMPYGMLVYGSYEVYKDMIVEGLPRLGSDATSLVAAVLSDITGSIWLSPSEIVKQQMQSAAVGDKTTVFSAFANAWNAGGITAFYQGYGGLLLRDIPFRALQLPMYERVKVWLDDHLLTDATVARLPGSDRNAWREGLAGVISGSVSSAITTPFDVIKTRLQVDPTSYTGPWDCGVKVFQKEGIRGLYSGVVPRTLYIGPSTALFFVAYGAVRSYMHRESQNPASILQTSSIKKENTKSSSSRSKSSSNEAPHVAPRAPHSFSLPERPFQGGLQFLSLPSSLPFSLLQKRPREDRLENHQHLQQLLKKKKEHK